MEIRRTYEEAEEALSEQLNFLFNSTNAFDSGDISEIKRATVAIRNLLKDTNGPTTSILTQLNKKDISFVSTALNQDGDFLVMNASNVTAELRPTYFGLVYREVTQQKGRTEFYFRPVFATSEYLNEKELDFETWWTEVILEDSQSEVSLTRKKLIESISEQDGGAHVDPTISTDYHLFRQKESKSILSKGDPVTFVNNPAFVSIRQIIYEIYESFIRDPSLKKFIKYIPKKHIPEEYKNEKFVWGTYLRFLSDYFPNSEHNRNLELKIFDLIKSKKFRFDHLIMAFNTNNNILRSAILEWRENNMGLKFTRSEKIALMMHMQYRNIGFAKTLDDNLVRICEEWNERIK